MFQGPLTHDFEQRADFTFRRQEPIALLPGGGSESAMLPSRNRQVRCRAKILKHPVDAEWLDQRLRLYRF
jgi:hypothetical protein